MIVLWIILGILACILLLLCFPVALELSYWLPEDKKGETRPYYSTETEKQLEGLELSESDRQALIQAVEGLGTYEAKPEKELLVRLRYLLFHFDLYPMKEKKPAPQEKEQESAVPKKKKPEAPKEKEESFHPLAYLPMIWECAKKPLEMILNGICLKRLKLDVRVSGSDTAESALGAEKLAMAAYSLLGAAQNYICVKKADICIRPDFLGEESDWQVCLRVQMHPIVVVGAGLRFGVCFAWKVLSKAKTAEKENSTVSPEKGGKTEDKTEKR